MVIEIIGDQIFNIYENLKCETVAISVEDVDSYIEETKEIRKEKDSEEKELVQTIEDIKDLLELCCDNNVNFEKAATTAQIMQAPNETMKAEDYKDYLDATKSTPTFKAADRLITKMLNNKNLDNALGFSTPKLILDPNVKNFYDFKSPKMRTGSALTVENGQLVREGKFVDNPESSFNVINYNPETEGKELSMRVPVAE